MKALVFGASGLLGSNVAVTADTRGFDVVGTYHTTEPELEIDCRQCDITDSTTTHQLITECDPDVVINCAAMTDVDACERNPETAQAVNAEAPKQIARVCSDHEINCIHISTDYVFNGKQDHAYAVDDAPDPLQHYGKTKYAGERAVEATHPSALIIRLSFIYGIHQSTAELTGFPAWVTNKLQNGDSVPLFTDQFVTPSRAGQAAETILELNADTRSGLFHVACRDCVTPYQFGKQIADRLGKQELISKSSQDSVDRLAPRPTRTCLSVEHTEQALDRLQPTLATELDELCFDQI